MTIAALSWYRPALWSVLKGGYTRADFRADLGAGLLVALVALPLSMGLAIACGVDPAQGLITSVIGGVIISVLGGSRVQVAGPAGAFVGLCASGVHDFGYGGLACATLMAGVLVVAMGLMRLGRAISYVPMPVLVGFASGIAVIIASTQAAPMCGIHAVAAETVWERLRVIWASRHEIQPSAIGATVATIAIISLFRRLRPLWPGAVIAVVAVTLVAQSPGLGLPTIGSAFPGFGSIGALPHLQLGPPGHDLLSQAGLARIESLSTLALSIALLGSLESLLSAVVADGLSGQRHEPDTELVAQGLANIASPLLGGLPVTGVIARTSTNIRGGARTPVASMIHALGVAACLFLLPSLVRLVPLCALAGVLLSVCWFMAEARHWGPILRAHQGDAVLLPAVFLLTVFIGLIHAVLIGVLLGMLFCIARLAASTRLERHGGSAESGRIGDGPSIPADVDVFTVHGPFFFGAATLLRDLDAEVRRRPRALILRLARVPFIDTTAGQALRELAASCRHQGAAFHLCEVQPSCAQDLERQGLDRVIGPERIHQDLATALAALPAPPRANEPAARQAGASHA
jgi:SulP family sulfate permease